MTLAQIDLHRSDGTSISLVPKSPTAGQLWYLKSWTEIGKTLAGSGSNFSALTLFADSAGLTGGQTCWVQLDAAEISLFLRVNNILFGSDTWHYLVEPSGRIYRTIDGADPDIPGASIRWPRIAIGSKGDGFRNQVMVLGYSADGKFARIAGIPKSADYSKYSPATHPWLFHRDYCIYLNGVIGDSPKGILYMPILDPATGYKISTGDNGLWLPVEYLYGMVGVPVSSPAITHELLTLASPHLMTAHLYRIDLTRVRPFVTAALGFKETPQKALERYAADLVLNGDGGPWLTGQLTSAGRWMSDGKWIVQNLNEGSIWFDRAGNCQISYSQPSGFSPYQVVSGPKQQIYNGAIVKQYDDSFIAARQCFGLFDDSHAFVLSTEGQEGTSEGATEQDTAEVGLSLGAQHMMMLDSGGSVSTAFKGGVSYSVEQRPVLNCLAFTMK